MQALELRERLRLLGRVAESSIGHRQLVVGHLVGRARRDGVLKMGDGKLGLALGDQHARQADARVLEVGVVLQRQLEQLAGPL